MVSKKIRNILFYIGLFLVGITMIVLGVYSYFSGEKEAIRKQKKEELETIANLKITEISAWYADEIHDAQIISEGKHFSSMVEDWISTPSTIVEKMLKDQLKQLAIEHDYQSVSIFSVDLKYSITSSKEHDHIDSSIVRFASAALLSKTACSTDLSRCPIDGKIYIDFIAPVLNSKGEPIAVVTFKHDPEKFLFPLIQNWPVHSHTSETLILRKEGDEVLFLNNLRQIKDAALNLRIPLTEKNVPAVIAANGYRGFVDGYDYRKVPVLAYVDSIPGTPWYFVAKIDNQELFNNFFFETASPVIVSTILILLLLLLFYFYYVNQQKNSFKKQYQSQQEYKTTLYSIGDAVITTNSFGQVLYLNPVAEKLTGWTEQDALNKPIQDVFVIINEESRLAVESPVKLVIENGKTVGLANHTLLISKQGDEIPIADSGAPIFDSNGNITGVVLVFRDQTIERSHQNAIIEKQRELTTLLSNLPGMAYRCMNDENWTMEFVSKGCDELTGYSFLELENSRFISYGELIHPDDRQKVWDNVQTNLNFNSSFQIEYRIITKNGDEKWVWEKGQGIFNIEGNLIAIEGFISDINDRKVAEFALHQSEEIFNHFMKFSPVYVFFKDENIRSLRLSQNYEQMLGLPMSELLGKNMDELFPSDFAKKMILDDQQILREEKEIVVEEEFNGRNYMTIKFPVKIDGKPTYLAGFTMDITDRKRMEEALRASEHLFQTLAENSSVGIFRTDAQGMTTYVNPMWCKLAGMDSGQALGLGWLNSVHPDDRASILEDWEKASAEHVMANAEYRFIHPDGKIVWVKGQAVSELNGQGKLVGYIGSITDISESIQATETLHDANKLLRTIIDNIPDAVYMKDIEGRKVIANKADVENCGCNYEEELVGKNDFDMFPNEIASKFWEDDQQVLKAGITVLQREEKLINFKNKVKWLITSKIPLNDKNGKIVGLVGIGHDITRRKIAEDEMLKLTKAITQSPISIVITDSAGNIEYVNPKFSEITGYSFEEVIGKNPRLLKSGAQTSEFYVEMWQTILAGNDWNAEFRNKKKNGDLYWENVNISPVLNEKGEIMNFIAIKEDITEKKKILEELISAKEKAEESDKLKSSFLANMSHEIRTPLNSILGFSNFLTSEDDLTSKEKTEFSNIINKSAESLLQIINDIIDISSLETGQLKTFFTNLQVNSILRSLHTVFSLKLIEINKSHLFLTLLQKEDITVFADENRFIQVITNLLNNSIKFTVRGEICFGVESIEEEKVLFIVSDTGIGIKPEVQDTIFERFRQGEEDTNRTFGGNGLGLSIVKNLVGLMGGEISLESEVGKGSKFRFWLPRKQITKS
jgi:PAS domain S-box-containing protein